MTANPLCDHTNHMADAKACNTLFALKVIAFVQGEESEPYKAAYAEHLAALKENSGANPSIDELYADLAEMEA